MQSVERGWRQVFLLALILQLAGTVVRKTWPDLVSKNQVFALAVAVVLLKLIYGVPRAAKRYAQARRDGASLSGALLTLIPVEILGLFRLERATQQGLGAWLRRKPPVLDDIPGQRFGFYKNSQYGTIFIIVMLSCVTEVPFSYFLMGIIEKDPVKAQYMHWFLLVSVIYTVLLLLGDRHLIRFTQHVLGSTGLHLRVGARFKADVPWNAVKDAYAIKSLKELQEARSEWLRRNGFEPSETVIGTPIDGPNVALVLDPSVSVDIEKFKIAQHGIRHVLLYVDDPTAFIHALRERIGAQCASGQPLARC